MASGYPVSRRIEPRAPTCRACGDWLRHKNAWMEDGCPCNSRRGVNDGLVCPQCRTVRKDAHCACRGDAPARPAAGGPGGG
jgi:hypothetical protein